MIVATRRSWAKRGRRAFLAVAFFFVALAPAFGQAGFLADLDANLARLSVPIDVSTATTTLLIAAPTGKTPGGATQTIHITAFLLDWAGTGQAQFVTGTQTTNPCDTGATNLTGNLNGVSGTVIPHGNGFGQILAVPAGQQVCLVTTQAVGIRGAVTYQVF